MEKSIPLEPAAKQVCKEASKPPLIFELPPVEGRKVLENMQEEPVCKCPASVSQTYFDTGKWGKIPV